MAQNPTTAVTSLGFDQVRSTRVSDDVVRQVTDAISTGRLRPGDRLPSQRELQRMLGAGHAAILEALRVLEASGLVTIRRGAHGGTFVNNVAQTRVADALNLMIKVNHVSLPELYDFRELVESHNASRFADLGDPKKAKELERAVSALAEFGTATDDTWEAIVAAELDCHRIVAQGAENRLITAFTQELHSVTLEATLKVPTTYYARMTSDWQDIGDAIQSGNAEAASEVMRNHVLFFSNLIQAEDKAQH